MNYHWASDNMLHGNKGKKRPDLTLRNLIDPPSRRPEVKSKISAALKEKHNSPKTEFKKGYEPTWSFKYRIAWNKGLTKEIDKRVKGGKIFQILNTEILNPPPIVLGTI